MGHLVRFLVTLFLIVALAAAITAEIFAGNALKQVDPSAAVLIVAAVIIFDFAALFFVARVNAGVIFPPRSRPYRLGDPGIGQRDDYDSDIRDPEITAMRDAKRARDLDRAMEIMARIPTRAADQAKDD